MVQLLSFARLSFVLFAVAFVASCSAGGDATAPSANPTVAGGGVTERVVTPPTGPTDPTDPPVTVSNKLVTLRGSSAFESGVLDDELTGLRQESIRADVEDGEDSFGFDEATPTQTQQQNRFRFEYGNQPSFERVGAAFALYARTGGSTSGLVAAQSGGLDYDFGGDGSTISYVTNRRFGRFTEGVLVDTVAQHPEFGLATHTVNGETVLTVRGGAGTVVRGGDPLVRVFVNDISQITGAGRFAVADSQAFGGVALRHLFQTTNDSGFLQLQTSLLASFNPQRLNPGYVVGPRSIIQALIDDGVEITGSIQITGHSYAGLSVQTVQPGYTQFTGSSQVYIGDGTWAEATAADLGLLALIRGLVNPDDSDSLQALRVATHGLAPEADLRVLTTHGLTETGNTVNGTANGVAEVQGGVNVRDAILQAGAAPQQKRGNVILFDNRLAAGGLTMVLAYADADNPATDNLLRLTRASNETFTTTLSDYFVRDDEGVVQLLETVPTTNLLGVREQDGFEAQGAANPTAITQAQAIEAVIQGHYGAATSLRQRGDRGGDVVGALHTLMRLRYASGGDYDALIFAAEEEAKDVGLWAGLPLYVDDVVARQRALIEGDDGVMARGLREFGRTNAFMLEVLSAAARAGDNGNKVTTSLSYRPATGSLTLTDTSGNEVRVSNVTPEVFAALDGSASFDFQEHLDFSTFTILPRLVITLSGGEQIEYPHSALGITHTGETDDTEGSDRVTLYNEIATAAVARGTDGYAYAETRRSSLHFIQGFDSIEFIGAPEALYTALQGGDEATFALTSGGGVRVTLSDGTTTHTLPAPSSFIIDSLITADGSSLHVHDRHTGYRFTFDDVPSALTSGLDKDAEFEFIDQTNQVRVTLSNGDVHMLEAPDNIMTPLPYYLAVVAAEAGETPCGAIARDFCIAAPGSYNYRDPKDNRYDDNDVLAQSEATARGAAALVASGFAVLQEIFDGQLNTVALLDRIKQTAAQNFDLDADNENDYTQYGGRDRYGHGLFDMECASRPGMTRERCSKIVDTTRTGARYEANAARCAMLDQQFDGSACVAECPAGTALPGGVVTGRADNECVPVAECSAVNAGVVDGACSTSVDVAACVAAGALRNSVVTFVSVGCISTVDCLADPLAVVLDNNECVSRRNCAAIHLRGVDSQRRCVPPNGDEALCAAASTALHRTDLAVLSRDGSHCISGVERCLDGTMNLSTSITVEGGNGYDPDLNQCVAPSQASCSALGVSVLGTSVILLSAPGETPTCVDSTACALDENRDSNGNARTAITTGTLAGLCLSDAERQARMAQVADGNLEQNIFGDTTSPTDTEINRDIVNLFAGAIIGNGASEWQRIEHQNQPSLLWVRAAHAYGYKVGANGDPNLGKGQNVRVITANRFDSGHPEFASSISSTTSQQLMRLFVKDSVDTSASSGKSWQEIAQAFFKSSARTGRNMVQGYSEGRSDSDRSFYFSAPFSVDPTQAEATAGKIVESLRDSIVSSSAFGVNLTPTKMEMGNFFLDTRHVYLDLANGLITAINQGASAGDRHLALQLLGALYDEESNIVSHEIVVTGDTQLNTHGDIGYLSSAPTLATAEQMGLLALINGLRNPEDSQRDVNTHGIAPDASLFVYTSPKAGATGFNGADLIARARGIDVITEDNPKRDIVLIQNVIASEARTEEATQANVNDVVGLAGSTIADDYKAIYDVLAAGVSNTATQDIYVFAAQDGRGEKNDAGTKTDGAKDAGLLASLAAAQGDVLKDYSIVVVAAEQYQSYTDANNYQENTPCGALVQAICIAAPGSYTYRDQGTDNVYDDDDTLKTATSANAAASLVAGGIALLGQIFPNLSSAEIVARILSTASRTFDLDGDGRFDYFGEFGLSSLSPSPTSAIAVAARARFGVGLLDLACATSPVLRANDPRCVSPLTSSGCETQEGVRSSGGCAALVNRVVADCVRIGAVLNKTNIRIRSSIDGDCITPAECFRLVVATQTPEVTPGRIIVGGRCLNVDARTRSNTPAVLAAAVACRSQGIGERNYLAQTGSGDGCITRAMCEADGFVIADPEGSGTPRCVVALHQQARGCNERHSATVLLLNVSRTRCIETCEPSQGIGTAENGARYCKIPTSLAECQDTHPIFEGTDGTQGRCVASAADCSAGFVLGTSLEGDKGSRCVAVAECLDANLYVSADGTACSRPRATNHPLHLEADRHNDILAADADDARNNLFLGDASGAKNLTDDGSIENVRTLIAREYQNQPSLQTVGTAATYTSRVDDVADNGRIGDLNQLKMGQGAEVSYVTNTLFDPTHPEFSSSNTNLPYDVVTRYGFFIDRIAASGGTFTESSHFASGDDIDGVGALFFARDSSGIVRLLQERAVHSDEPQFYFTVPVGLEALVDRTTASGGRARDTALTDSSAGADRRAALQAFFRSIMGGAGVFQGKGNEVFIAEGDGTALPSANTGAYGLVVQGDTSINPLAGAYVALVGATAVPTLIPSYVGRQYHVGNIAGYQIVANPGEALQKDDGTDTAYIANTFASSASDMGVMALINGLINPSASTTDNLRDANTHGIAPGARLSVFTTPTFDSDGDDEARPADLIARARGIDIGRENANPDRNIVILSNTIIDSAATLAANSTNVNAVTNDYLAVSQALELGVADTATQDIYVFAAADGRGDSKTGGTKANGLNDAGVFAALALKETSSAQLIKDYSIVVVAVERFSAYVDANNYVENTPCGDFVADICIAAPGSYKYRDKSGVNYEDSLTDGASANAAAALVGGGLALLESIFGDSLSSKDMVARILATASKNFDLSNAADDSDTPDGDNDYVDESGGLTKEQRFGVGLLDVYCAASPTYDSSNPRLGCDADLCPANTLFDGTLQRCIPVAEGCSDGRVLLDTSCVNKSACLTANMGLNAAGTACAAPSAVSATATAADEAEAAAMCTQVGGYYFLDANDVATCENLGGETIADVCVGASNRNLSIDGTICYAHNPNGFPRCPVGQGVLTATFQCIDVSRLSAAQGVAACRVTRGIDNAGFSISSTDIIRGYDPIAKTCVNSRSDCSPGLKRAYQQNDPSSAITSVAPDLSVGTGGFTCLPNLRLLTQTPSEPDTAITGVDDATKAKALFTGEAIDQALTMPTTEMPLNNQARIAWEHRNQPSLVAIRAAGAYVRDITGTISSLDELHLGDGGRVSYVTSSRFDPNHPEFTSSDDSSYRTLVRFKAVVGSGNTDLSDIFSTLVDSDQSQTRLNKGVVYYEDGTSGNDVYASVPILPLALSDFGNERASTAMLESAGLDETTIEQIRSNPGDINGLLRFFAWRILSGDEVRYSWEIALNGDNSRIEFARGNDATLNYIDIASMQMLGRVYNGASNIRSYQLVISTDAQAHTQGGVPVGFVPVVSAADMGVMALINGMLNPEAGESNEALTLSNTHGVAPAAVLDVFSTPHFGHAAFNVNDLIYRATGYDHGRTSNSDRNIVLLSNAIVDPAASAEATQTNVDAAFANGGAYRALYDAITTTQTGVANAKKDIFVFAAADGRDAGVGIFASLPISTESDNPLKDVSIVVVAAEAGASPCGTLVAAVCIAAPGAYKYRDKVNGKYQEALRDGASANAAASLVAGGFALLESVFGNQITSAQMVALVLATASENFDLDGDSMNDYDATKHGKGLLDLECAARPGVSRTDRTASGCSTDMVTLPAKSTLASQADCVAQSQVLGANGLCVASCAADNVAGSVRGIGSMVNSCITATDCRGGTNNGAVVNGACMQATGRNCDRDGDRVFATDKCIANARLCLSEGTSTGMGYNSGTNSCVTPTRADECANVSLVLIVADNTDNRCGAASECPAGQGVVAGSCVNVATISDATQRMQACQAAGREVVGTTCGIGADTIIGAFRGTGNTEDDSDLINSKRVTDSSSRAERRQREYANQKSLDVVGAAFAYGAAGNGSTNEAEALLELGKGSYISVITDKRFDPTHPEFSSATATSFDTLTRFYFKGPASTFSDITDVVSTIFDDDSGEVVQVYTSKQDDDEVWFSVPVGVQIDGMNFEDISRDDSDNTNARLNAIAAFLAEFVGGDSSISDPKNVVASDTTDYWRYELDDDGNYYIGINFGSDPDDDSGPANAQGFHHVGRTYDATGNNIRSYQVVIQSLDWVRGPGQSEECLADDNSDSDGCYDGATSDLADGSEMGIFALINGLMNPDATGVTYNTHGIAPGAKLDVITTNELNEDRSNARDSVLRARSIDIGRDSGIDDERNIVIIQNGIAANSNDGTLTNVNDDTESGGDHQSLYEALQEGLADNTPQQQQMQDAYVFAAQDGDEDDVGSLAATPISTEGTSILKYSIIVVAVEADQTECGSNTMVQSICIAAPGEYRYRNRSNSGVYATKLKKATSANAAASLVAGGLALLESIFPTETTERLIDRLLMTASKNYDLDGVTGNDYTVTKHGQGLMDLACAIKPMTSTTLDSTIRTSAGCVDRHAPAGMSAPQQKPESDPIPTGSAQGDKGDDDAAQASAPKAPSVDYCDIDGLRIILSGDLCSDDYVTLVDKDGNLNPHALGNLRFGMGFGDALAGAAAFGGITFFDAFDTAWTVDNPYNPYAHLLDIGSIVIAPAQSRFDVEDRFYAMRYGTRPGTRKTWHSDTASIVMDFATQGMATKPYAVTRGQIRNTLTHDNMGADPYADVRFMLSAEDNIGVGRLKVMTYSGMAMGYALGLHAQGDAMMPSYLLTNRDSFHAPYLSLASSGLGGGMTYRFNDGGHIGFVMGEGTSLNADGTLPYQQQTSRPRAFAGMMEYAPHQNLMFHVGALQEETTLLASQGSGLFDIEGGATAFVGVQAKQPLADNWQALLSGYGGRTQLAGSRGIVEGLDVMTSSFDVGLLGSHLLEKGDHLLLRAGQPMRVESGSLDLSYVSFRRQDRSSVGNVQSFDVAPSMRSVEFGVGYGLPVGVNGRSGHVRFAIDYVLNPGHRRVQNEVFGIMSFRREF